MYTGLSKLPVPQNAITIQALSKTYTKQGVTKRALDGIDLTIERGSMMALLGPNGAGKSTVINILAGLVNKTDGRVNIWGIDIDENHLLGKHALGIVPQEIIIDPFFTPFEALTLQAGLYGVRHPADEAMRVLDALGLKDKAYAYARTLSGGMRRRLMVAKAMVHKPPILILDEPTAGVDIQLRQQLWQYVKTLNAQGTTVLLTTHYLEEAQELCDRIAIINHGKVVVDGLKQDLLKQLDKKRLIVGLGVALSWVPEILKVYAPDLSHDGQTLTLNFKPSIHPMAKILADIAQAGLNIMDLSTEEADLEDMFLEITR
jgi:ABC-2 type transport system ATP-binding protein